MFVVDLDALQAINLLDLTHDVVGQRLQTTKLQYIHRGKRPFHNDIALFNGLPVEDADLAIFWNRHLMQFARLIRNFEACLGLYFFTKRNDTRCLSQNRGLFCLSRLKQFRNSGQTAGDITGLGTFLRNSRKQLSHADFGAHTHHNRGARGHLVLRFDFVPAVYQFNRRLDIRGRAAAAFRVHHQVGA